MFTKYRVQTTILATVGWLILGLCWIALAWGRLTFFQGLAGLGISTLLFAAVVGVVWVLDHGLILAATILATLGWLSLMLYWIGFVWSRYGLLQNGVTLIASFLLWMGIMVVLWLRRRADACC